MWTANGEHTVLARTQVPGTELVVTRTAYKNNTSKYQVDGRTKTYKEVRGHGGREEIRVHA